MATAPQTTNTTTLSGLPVQTQPGAQLPYGPGASTPYAGQTGAMPMQTSAVPASVTTAGPVVTPETTIVKNSLDQIQAGAPPMQNANEQVQESIASFENNGSQYMQNAIRRGLETAAARGLGNSSIAAGAAQRSALEAITPFVQESLDTQRQREGQQFTSQQNQLAQALDIYKQNSSQNFQGSQNALDRAQALQQQREGLAFQGEQSALDREHRAKLQQDATYQQDWLADRNYTREFNGALSQLPIQNAFQMQQLVAQYALENPEVYTPQVVSGMTNFLQNNMMSILKQYFPNAITVK